MFKSVVSRRSTFVTARRVANVSSSNKSLPRFFTSDAAATEATETPTPSLTNTQAKKHNSKILMAKRLKEKQEMKDFRKACQARMPEYYAMLNEQIKIKNYKYLAQQEEMQLARKRKAIISAKKQAAHAERERIRKLAYEEYRSQQAEILKRKEALKSEARMEYLKAIASDTNKFIESPDELELSRFRIANPKEFNLKNN
mmetsp:Transcript_15568/g.26786  ORF Transcript_15568/g.26786 Transcript_15568/m.26786 type:complete len:200 (-) Transcript_15568:25-624(-)